MALAKAPEGLQAAVSRVLASPTDLLGQQGSKLVPSQAATATSSFGEAVAISADGSTAAVGSDMDDANLGGVFVFVRSGSTWVQQGPMLIPTDGSVEDHFGSSLALSSDGSTLLVGGSDWNGFEDTGVGGAWVFARSGSIWSQQGPGLVPDDASGPSGFGTSVALSADGNTAVVGGPSDDGSVGAVWTFTRSGSSWTQQGSKLPGPSWCEAANSFGASVSLSSSAGTLLVGAPGALCNGTDFGVAWVFTASSSGWSQEAGPLLGLDPDDTEQGFGQAVALSGDGSTALVGGWEGEQADIFSGPGWALQTQYGILNGGSTGFGWSLALSENGGTAVIGSLGGPNVWVLTRSADGWDAFDPTTVAPDDASGTPGQSDFGQGVALSGDGSTLLVGGPTDAGVGALWSFSAASGSWAQQGSKVTGLRNELAGYSVALSADGNTALVGDPGYDQYEGAAFVFTRSGTTWTEEGGPLLPGDENTSECNSEFGSSVALSADGDTALIGGPLDDAFDGAAWVFTRSGDVWSQDGAKLTPTDEDESGGGGQFGASVALSSDGTTALIGAPYDGSDWAGAAWIFTLSGSTWTQQGPKLTGSGEDNSGGGGLFGTAVALSGDGQTALVGAPFNGSDDAGAAWVFTHIQGTILWDQQGGELTGSGEDNSGGGGGFGDAVALSSNGDTALIGAPFDGATNAGAAWVFTRSATTWTEDGQKLTPSDEDNTGGGGWFGFSVALSSDGSTGLIGAPLDSPTAAGAAWLFGSSGTTWTQLGSKLTASDEVDSSDDGDFGFSVALSSDATTGLIGGPGDGGYDAGAAWAFAAAPATAPGAPTGVSAVASNGQATVSFQAPVSNGGSPISSYTVTASPGGAHAAGASTPITVTGLTNGTSYTFTVTATNSVGTGPASGSSNAVTPMAPASGGGGGGGGGGSDAIAITISPSSQSVSGGGTATFTVAITNTGGGYLFNVGASDPATPSCNQATASTPASTLATLETMAPEVTVTYACTATVSSSLTNTVTASGTGPDGVTVTASASASVTVTGSASPAPFTPPATSTVHSSGGSTTASTSKKVTSSPVVSVTVTGLKVVTLGKNVSLHLTTKLSAATVFDLVLLNSKGHTLTRWVIHGTKGSHLLALLLLAKARTPGHDKLEITEHGSTKTKTLPLLLKV